MSEATTGVPAANASVSTMPNDSPPSDGAHEEVGLAQRLALALVGDLAERVDAAVVEQHAVDLVGRRADDLSWTGRCSRSASKARSSTGSPLRSTAWPTKTSSQRLTRERVAASPAGPGLDVHAVGDDAVAAAVEAPPGPGGRLGHRDPHAQAVQPPPGAGDVAGVVRQPVGRVAVERADERDVGGHERVPADDRGVRLVEVHHVVAADRERRAQARDRGRRHRQVRHRAVRREPERPTERHEPFGQLPILRLRPLVQAGGAPVGRVDRGEDRDVVAGPA